MSDRRPTCLACVYAQKLKKRKKRGEGKYEKSHRAPLLSNHEREKHRVFYKARSKVARSWRWPTLKLSTRDFSPPPAVYRPRETAFSPLSPWPLFAIHPSVGFTFGLALALVLVLFPAALFRAHQSATNTRDGSALPSAIPASVPRRYVKARLACLERERGSHT